VLARLVVEPADKPTLVADLDVSRSTVDRAVRELSVHGLVERRDGRVAVTLAGRLAHRAFLDCRERTRAVLDVEPLLAHLPPDCEVDERVLLDAEVVEPVPAGPGPRRDLTDEFLDGASRLRALIQGITKPDAVGEIRDAVADGMAYEPVFATDAAAFVRARQREEAEAMTATGRFRAFETGPLPFGLYLAETADGVRVALVVHDDANDYRGTLVADDPDAFEWARDVYERYRRDAVEITDEFAD
jgi:predicted transcriptional regulator